MKKWKAVQIKSKKNYWQLQQDVNRIMLNEINCKQKRGNKNKSINFLKNPNANKILVENSIPY